MMQEHPYQRHLRRKKSTTSTNFEEIESLNGMASFKSFDADGIKVPLK
jgi:hypothetical protein